MQTTDDVIHRAGFYKQTYGGVGAVHVFEYRTRLAHGEVYTETGTERHSWNTQTGRSVLPGGSMHDLKCYAPKDPEGSYRPKMRTESRNLLKPTKNGAYILRDGKVAEVVVGELGAVGYLLPHKRRRFNWSLDGTSLDKPHRWDIIDPNHKLNHNSTEYTLDQLREFKRLLSFVNKRTNSTLFVLESPKHSEWVITVDADLEKRRDHYVYYEDIMIYYTRIHTRDESPREIEL